MSPGPPESGLAGRLAAHALAKPGAWADQPWEGDHVAKVADRIFAFLGESSLGVKCGTRAEADEWLQEYPTTCGSCPTSAGAGGTP